VSIAAIFLATALIGLLTGTVFMGVPYAAFVLRGDEMSERVESVASFLYALGVVLVSLGIALLIGAGAARLIEAIQA
jgi:hypothetical protein